MDLPSPRAVAGGRGRLGRFGESILFRLYFILAGMASIYKHDIGARLRCDWREGDQRDCEVIERRLVDDVPQYYIHYADFNRRLDEWVDDERLHVPQPSAMRVGNERKRKLDPAVASCPTPLSHAADEAAAGELDAATQREHEAATRVKNINAIQLGKWRIQTWCALVPSRLMG